MSLVHSEIRLRSRLLSLQSSSSWPSSSSHNLFQRETNPQAPSPPSSLSVGKISPAVLFIIIVLAVLFFISGILHLLVRILKKQRSPSSFLESNRYPENMPGSDAFQRQLQQLFNHHDCGLDQACIDTLPVFHFNEIVGLKEQFQFDCAICLCEFSEQDRLRLLPMCSHAFHIDCVDTWLHSNSSCPVCRGVLYTPGIGIDNPVFDFEDSMDQEDGFGIHCNVGGVGVGRLADKAVEIEICNEKRVFPVKLGKFRSTSNERQEESGGEKEGKDVGETSSSKLDARKCHSMGSYQYVVADSVLQVALCPNPNLRVLKGTSEQDGSFSSANDDAEARKIHAGCKFESLSVSKIWLWSKKGHSSSTEFSGNPIHMNDFSWTNRDQAM